VAWTTSQRFRDTVPTNHALTTDCTITVPGGAPVALQLSAGTVPVDRTQQVRRTAQLAVRGGTAVYDLLSTPGALVRLSHGFQWSSTNRELVPLITGEITSASLAVGDGLVGITLADLWSRLTAAEYDTPYVPDVASTRVAEVIAAVTSAMPGTFIRNSATDTGTVGTVQAWTSRAQLISSFAGDGGFEAFFAPDGSFVIRDVPQLTDQVVWTIKPGDPKDGATLESLTRTRPLDRLYNAVVVTPATQDPLQAWDSVTAVITDPANPRHPSRLGVVRPYRFSSPTALTEDEAIAGAEQLLVKVQGTTETLALGALCNPALDGGDVVEVQAPADSGAASVRHFIDSLSIDVVSGSMSANTRSDQELAA
jgi:hypothetical protein